MSLSSSLTSLEVQALSSISERSSQALVSASISLAKGDYVHARNLCLSNLKGISEINSREVVSKNAFDGLENLDSIRSALGSYKRLDVGDMSGEINARAISNLAHVFSRVDAEAFQHLFLFEFLLAESLELEMLTVLFELENMFMGEDYDNCIKRCERNSLLIESFYQDHSAGFLGSKVDAWYQGVMQRLAELSQAAKFVSVSGGVEGLQANFELRANKKYEYIASLVANKSWKEVVDCSQQELSRIKNQGLDKANEFTYTLLATITQPLLARLELVLAEAQVNLSKQAVPISRNKVFPMLAPDGIASNASGNYKHGSNSNGQEIKRHFGSSSSAALFSKLNFNFKNLYPRNKVAVTNATDDCCSVAEMQKEMRRSPNSVASSVASGANPPVAVMWR